jgi:hypothetical protein
MEHFVGPAEFFRARNLAVEGRELATVAWGLRKIDAACCRGKVEDFLRGVRTYFYAEKERIEREIQQTVFTAWVPVPPELQPGAMARESAWNSHIASDHPLFEAFRLLNDLAARHGIPLLYYTEQVNVTAQRDKGNDVRIVENFETLEREITGGPNVHYLKLIDRNPPEMFSDAVDHLEPESIDALAGILAREIRAIRESGPKNASATGE